MAENGDRVRARADALFPEEQAAGSDNPLAQAEAILEESDDREEDRVDPAGQPVEHRRSEDTVELPVVDEQRSDQTPDQELPKP